jgi:hypothetical protein
VGMKFNQQEWNDKILQEEVGLKFLLLKMDGLRLNIYLVKLKVLESMEDLSRISLEKILD